MITSTIYIACDECMEQVERDLDDHTGWWVHLLDEGWEITYTSESDWERTRNPRHIDTTTCPACVAYRNEEED